jgi:hypothetical protein
MLMCPRCKYKYAKPIEKFDIPIKEDNTMDEIMHTSEKNMLEFKNLDKIAYKGMLYMFLVVGLAVALNINWTTTA